MTRDMRLALALLAALFIANAGPAQTTRPSALPDPESYLGFRPGADRRLASWAQITGYFRAVAAASDHVRVEEIGQSTNGQPFIVAYVSSPKNLARLDAIREANRRLARGEEEAAAAAASDDQPVTVLLTAGIHATEFTGTQAAPELLWLLATGRARPADAHGNHWVFALVPSFNPDGLEIVRAWYERTLDTPFEGTWPPTLYHPYVGHDNNRDAYMLTQKESRLVNDLLYHSLNPQLYVDQHHMGNSDARMFIGEMYAPLNPSIDPQTVMNVQLVGSYMRSVMTAEGKRGLLHRANWNGFWQGGFFTNAWWHHVPAILTETATMRLASPIFQKPSDLDGSYFRGVGKNGNAKDWNHPWPWPGGWWRSRDGVEYDLSAAISALDAAVTFRAKLKEDRWRAARRSIEEGATAPVAWLFAPDQHDPGSRDRAALKLVLGGATVLVAHVPFEASGRSYPADTYVIPAAQPFRAFVKDFVEPQSYPDRRAAPDGPPEQPFDWTGWTPAMQMGVRVERVVAWPGGAAPAAVPLDPESRRAASRPALTPAALDWWKTADRTVVPLRVGIYQPWTASMDEGWNRWILEQYARPYVTLHDDDVRAGGLRSRFDSILLPSIGARSIRDGHGTGNMPPEFCGGLGPDGAAALVSFVKAGGRLVCLDDSCDYAREIFAAEELPVECVTSKLDQKTFSCPGSLLGVEIEAEAPLTWRAGLPTELIVPFANSRAFEMRAPEPTTSTRPASPRRAVIARYATRTLCRSGWILGPEKIAGKAMAVAVGVGGGTVVLFGAPIQFRGQSEAAFPLLFNALYRP